MAFFLPWLAVGVGLSFTGWVCIRLYHKMILPMISLKKSWKLCQNEWQNASNMLKPHQLGQACFQLRNP